MPNPTVTIAGVDRTNKTIIDSVTVTRSYNERSTCQVELIETAGTYRPVPGNPIIIQQVMVAGSPGSTIKRFAGLIEDIEEQAVPGASPTISYRCGAIDYTRLLDWRLYAGSFENQTLYNIVETIWNAKLSDDGVTLGGVANPGPTITERLQDGLRPITEWFRKLSTATGYLFRIDEDKVLQFSMLPTSPATPAPFSITWTSGNWRDLKISKRMGDYRNRQYVRTEYNISGSLTANFTGDGSTRDFFQFDGPFHGTPALTVNGVAQTMGRWGFDQSGFDYYYDVEGWGIHRYPSQSAPAGGAALVLTYGVRFQNYTQEESASEITARAAIQGDSGIVEAISEDRYIDSAAGLTARATDLLRQYGTIPTEVTFETDSYIEVDSDWLEPGQQITINLTGGPSAVNDTFLVEAVESSWKAIGRADSDIWVHRVTCVDIEPIGHKATAVERLAEAVRIGPDQTTIATESPAPSPAASASWKATYVDEADPLTAAATSTHYPVDADDGEEIVLTDWWAALTTPANTSPAGTVTFDVERSSNDGGSWASLFSADLEFTAGDKQINGSTFAIGTLFPGDLLRGTVVTADGTAAGLTFVVNGSRQRT